jgi:hypothetical protein
MGNATRFFLTAPAGAAGTVGAKRPARERDGRCAEIWFPHPARVPPGAAPAGLGISGSGTKKTSGELPCAS